uniref:Hyaluronidase n=1 Tax=Cacopsylla melanoneura TaxID=428564 RepID=A0A8D8UZ88_9HEMI
MIVVAVILYLIRLTSGQYFNPNYNPFNQWFQPQQSALQHQYSVRQWPLPLLEHPLSPVQGQGLFQEQGFESHSPDNALPKERFDVYWNVPTFQCHQYGLNFSSVRQWGILDNENGHFRGDQIALLYDPGMFPALLRAGGGDFVKRNGGVPQEGDLELHIESLEAQINGKLIPDRSFSGLGIIDFEHWRPVFEENFGSLDEYRRVSRKIEKSRHPFMSYSAIDQQAEQRFEQAAKDFMYNSLILMKKLRPQAKWGYYGFPLCFNYTPRNQKPQCTPSVRDNNNRNRWLFSASSSLYPSLYLKHSNMTEIDRMRFMQGRLEETNRVRDASPVYPYIWFKYFDDKEFLKDSDMINSIIIPKKLGADGVIIWGSSNDVNSERKCRALVSYLHNTLGPAVKRVRRTPRVLLDDLIRSTLNQPEVEY